MKKISVDQVKLLLARLDAAMTVYAPVANGEQTDFARWNGEDVDLNTLKTAKSAKEAIFPQSEDIAAFRMEGKKISIEAQTLCNENFVVFGARACDIRGLEVLDKVFLADPVDTFYKARRDHAYIVGYACDRPSESCFCTVFGIDATAPQGDVTIAKCGDTLYWTANTQKGEELTALAGDALVDCASADTEAVAEQQAKTKAVLDRLPFGKLDLNGFDGDHLMEKFDSEKWQGLSRSCLGCGTCTFVCPTCQCYDVRDFKTNSGVQRYRCWDSCMYSDFTLMAHGNPRTTQLQRFRQRFMHKLVYFPANNDGVYSCVGCGRCVEKCPASLHIVKVIKALGGEHDGK